MELKPGATLQDGKYKITNVLGTGGFGITYLAQMKTIAKGQLGDITGYANVAIKEFFMKTCCNRDGSSNSVSYTNEVTKETFSIFRRKFEKEARILAQLKHPGIVPVLEIFQEYGTSYYVMEYITGRSINQLLDENGVFDIETALKYINHIGAALQHVHAQKFLHLDVKPDNILVRANGEPVLIDFGGAKHFTDEGDTESTTTPPVHSDGYSPIEVYSGVSTFMPEADVYSLAATFYKMITGIRPASAMELRKNPLKFNDNVPAHIQYAIRMAMQVLPENRLKSVQDFLDYANGNKPIPAAIPVAGAKDKEDTQLLNPADGERTVYIPKVNKVLPGQEGLEDTIVDSPVQEGDNRTEVSPAGTQTPPPPPPPVGESPATVNNAATRPVPVKPKKKMNGFIIGLVIAILLIGVGAFFGVRYFTEQHNDPTNILADSLGISKEDLKDSCEFTVDTIVYHNFQGAENFRVNLEAYADSMDGYKVDACEKIYKNYETAFNLCEKGKLPSLHSGVTHDDILLMCQKMSEYGNYWKQQCIDMGDKTEADNYAKLGEAWKSRGQKLKIK